MIHRPFGRRRNFPFLRKRYDVTHKTADINVKYSVLFKNKKQKKNQFFSENKIQVKVFDFKSLFFYFFHVHIGMWIHLSSLMHFAECITPLLTQVYKTVS